MIYVQYSLFRTNEDISDIFGGKGAGLVPSKHRVFIMDTQVKYTIVSSSSISASTYLILDGNSEDVAPYKKCL